MIETTTEQVVAANTWNAAIDAVASLVDGHYSGGHTAMLKLDLWVYDTDIGNMVRSLRRNPPHLDRGTADT